MHYHHVGIIEGRRRKEDERAGCACTRVTAPREHVLARGQMIPDLQIRPSGPADMPAIQSLYRDVFPNEDLWPLVSALLNGTPGVLSLVGTLRGAIVGHIAFTNCAIEGQPLTVALLGPLAVAPTHQRRGLGSALAREGLGALARQGVDLVFVLGDPGYYSRLGFAADRNISPPFPLPDTWREAWQLRRIGSTRAVRKGRLSVPEPWQHPGLWSP